MILVLLLFIIARCVSESAYFPVLFGVFYTCVTLLPTFPIFDSTSVNGLKYLMTLGPWKDGGKYSPGGPELAPVSHNGACYLSPSPPYFCLPQKYYRHTKLLKYLGDVWQGGVIFSCQFRLVD